MGAKYTLTTEDMRTHERTGSVLYRIRASRDIPRHNVKKGELGGFISSLDVLSQEGDCWVFDDAVVVGDSHISGNALIYNNAVVENSTISDEAIIGEYCEVCDSDVTGTSCVMGHSTVLTSSINGAVSVDGRTLVRESKLSGSTYTYGGAIIVSSRVMDSDIRGKSEARRSTIMHSHISGGSVDHSTVRFSTVLGDVLILNRSQVCYSRITAGKYTQCHIHGDEGEGETIVLSSAAQFNNAFCLTNNDMLVLPNVLGTEDTVAIYRTSSGMAAQMSIGTGNIHERCTFFDIEDASDIEGFLEDIACITEATHGTDVSAEAKLLSSLAALRLKVWNS